MNSKKSTFADTYPNLTHYSITSPEFCALNAFEIPPFDRINYSLEIMGDMPNSSYTHKDKSKGVVFIDLNDEGVENDFRSIEHRVGSILFSQAGFLNDKNREIKKLTAEFDNNFLAYYWENKE